MSLLRQIKSVIYSCYVRKPLTLLIASFTLVSNFSLTADAAVKAGANCVKVGLTSTTAGKKFTCVKSGKKFVWNKGVPVAKPASIPGVQTPVAIAPSASQLIVQEAFDAVQKATVANSRIKLKYETGNTLNSEFLNLITQLTDASILKYSIFLKEDLPTTIYIYSEKDQDIIRNNRVLGGQQDTFNYLEWYSKDKNVKDNSIGIAGHTYRATCKGPGVDCSPALNAAGAAYPSYSSSATQNEGNTTTIPHELFHVIQDVYMYDNLGSSYLSELDKHKISPSIFREGAATFMQCAASFEKISQYEACLNEKRKWLMNDSPKFKEITDARKLVSYLNELESSSAIAPHYVLGAVLTEWLIGKYGLIKFVDLVQTHSMKKDFKSVFESIYGISLTKAYEESAAHLLDRAK